MVLRPILKLLGLLPFKVLHFFSSILGILFYITPNHYRSITKTNLLLAFPDMKPLQVELLLLNSLINSNKSLIETGKIWYSISKGELSNYIVIDGLEFIVDSLNKGTGVILFTPHLGNIEVIIKYLGGRFDCTIPYTISKNQQFEKIMLDARKMMGVKMVEAKLSGVRSLYEDLIKGGLIAIAADQVPDKKNGEIATFFNRQALTMSLVSNLASKTHSPCHSVSCIRGKSGNIFKLFFSKPILDIGGSQIKDSVNLMNRELEKCIMKAPEQYAWEYKRFKHSNTKDPYNK